MDIKHHPHEDTLLSYAAGALPAAMALVVGAHLDGCEDCRRCVADAETVGGMLLHQVEPKKLGEDARQEIMQLIERTPPAQTTAPTPESAKKPVEGFIPRVLRELLDVSSYGELAWRTVAPGVRQLNLPLDEGNAFMLKIGAGRKMPVHSHRGNELTLILQGGYHDELGSFQVGDVADLDGSVEHRPIADEGEDCIVLAGLDDKVEFRGFLAKLFQPFTGM